MNKTQKRVMFSDPMFTAGWNEALEYSANWITYAIGDYSDETVSFAKANAMSLRAAKREIEQQDFFDAVRNDPTMKPEQKAYWLSIEPNNPPDWSKEEK